MIKMLKRALLTFLAFFCTYFILFIIEDKLLSNGTLKETLIKTIVYSCIYLIAILVCTRKHKQLIAVILIFLAILFIIAIPIFGGMTVKESVEVVKFDIPFWINSVIVGIQIYIANMQGEEYKEEKEEQTIQFEEMNKEGRIIRRGKIKQK